MPTPIQLPVVQYAPDLPAFQPGATVTVSGVIPKSKLSYGPLSDLQAFGGALGSRCQGAIGVIENASGQIDVFAGDGTNLWLYTSASSSPTNVSKSANVYTTPTDGRWNYAQFGTRLIATNYNDAMQSFTLGSSSVFADLAAAAPKCRYLATVKSFLIAAHTNDSTYGVQPQRVWWSANNDPTNWPTPGTALAAQFQSDYNDLVGEGGWIQGIVGNLGPTDAAVFMEHAVWRMVYSGPPATFAFIPAEGVRGTPAPGSIARLGAYVYYLGEDGFYKFDGATSVPIGSNRVDKFFYQNVDQANIHRVSSAVDPINKLVFWAYPDSNATNGNPNNLLIYNWDVDQWSYAAVTSEIIFRALTFGYTLDTMDVLGTLDSMSQLPLESRAFTGGKVILAGFDTNHRLSYFNGPLLAATVDTAEVNPFQGQRANLTMSRPLVDAGLPSVQIGLRDSTLLAVAYSTSNTVNAFGEVPLNLNGRYVRARITMPYGSTTWTHIEGIELIGDAAGFQ